VQISSPIPYYGSEIFNTLMGEHIFKQGAEDYPEKVFTYQSPPSHVVFTNVVLSLDVSYEGLRNNILVGIFLGSQEIWRVRIPASAKSNVMFTHKKDLSRYSAAFRDSGTFSFVLYATSEDLHEFFVAIVMRASFYDSRTSP
jgi:hypothetical protein